MRVTRFAQREGINQTPYRVRANIAHTNMTSSIRHAIIPFVWPSLLALISQCALDQDVVLQALLLLNELQISLRGINTRVQDLHKTTEDVIALQSLAFGLARTITTCLGANVSTKIAPPPVLRGTLWSAQNDI